MASFLFSVTKHNKTVHYITLFWITKRAGNMIKYSQTYLIQTIRNWFNLPYGCECNSSKTRCLYVTQQLQWHPTTVDVGPIIHKGFCSTKTSWRGCKFYTAIFQNMWKRSENGIARTKLVFIASSGENLKRLVQKVHFKHCSNTKVFALGFHFNINSYGDNFSKFKQC